MVGSLVVLSRWLDPGGFTRAMTLLFASSNVGSLLATSPLSAANDLVGWRATFLLLAVLTAVVGVIFYLIVRDERPGTAERSGRSEEHTSELQSLMRISYAVFCLKKKTHNKLNTLLILPIEHYKQKCCSIQP